MIIIVVWIGLSFFLISSSYKLGLGRLNNPGPGLMPFLIGVLLLLLSLYAVSANLFRKGGRDETIKNETSSVNFGKLGIVVALLVLYGLFLETLGFLIVTFLFLFFLFWNMGTRLISALIASVLTVLVSYFVFAYFGVRFPPGILRLVGI
jgi:putative tricarboxylic transport membrane protein